MGGQSEGRNHREEMAGTGEAMEQAEPGGSMDMPAVVVLPPHMQMEVLMGGSVDVMAMKMSLTLQKPTLLLSRMKLPGHNSYRL